MQIQRQCALTISINKPNWNYFRYQVDNNLRQVVSLKAETGIEDAVEHLYEATQRLARNLTPALIHKRTNETCPANI